MNNHCLVDSHVHTEFSDDCAVPVREQLERAVQLGLKGVALTDHYDIDYPNTKYNFEFDVDARRTYIADLKNQFSQQLELLHGIEIGIQPHVIEQSRKLVRQGDFDCVISSIHAVDGFSLCSQHDFFLHKTKQQAYRRYLEEIYYALCNFQDYDIVGHIGYIRRYGNYDDNSMPYEEYNDILDEILRVVIRDGKGIEINTSGFAYNLGTAIPDISILQRYYELGGTLVTLGSDAHSVERVAGDFDRAVKMLKDVGFTSIAYFKERMPIFQRI